MGAARDVARLLAQASPQGLDPEHITMATPLERLGFRGPICRTLRRELEAAFGEAIRPHLSGVRTAGDLAQVVERIRRRPSPPPDIPAPAPETPFPHPTEAGIACIRLMARVERLEGALRFLLPSVERQALRGEHIAELGVKRARRALAEAVETPEQRFQAIQHDFNLLFGELRRAARTAGPGAAP